MSGRANREVEQKCGTLRAQCEWPRESCLGQELGLVVVCVVHCVLCTMQNVCVSLVFGACLEIGLGLENFLKMELLILHMFYKLFLHFQGPTTIPRRG